MSSSAPVLAALTQAWRDRSLADATGLALADEDEAYAVNDGLVAALGWQAPGRPQFWKSGGASRQARITHAPLAPSGVRIGPASYADLGLHKPAIEAEIALRLGRTVTQAQAAALTREQAFALIDAMTVSAELVTSRWRQGSEAASLLRMADCQSHGALALAEWLPLRAIDWAAQTCAIQINEEPPQQSRGSHSLGDPGWLVLDWLRHATRHGVELPAGSVVTTGAWLVVKGLQPGDRATVVFDDIGSVEVRV